MAALSLQDVLRLPNSCKLRTSAGNFMPVTSESLNRCDSKNPSKGCNQYVSGDLRVNENAALTGLHVAFLREHNRLCDTLKNSGKSEDAKFETVRAVRFAGSKPSQPAVHLRRVQIVLALWVARATSCHGITCAPALTLCKIRRQTVPFCGPGPGHPSAAAA